MNLESGLKDNYKVQLFLFPFAGGGKTSFNRLTAHLDRQIEAITIEYSGRGDRINDGYITDYQEFVADVARQVNKYRNHSLPYAVLGYSMGTALAFELITNEYGWGIPEHAFFCARACLCDEKLVRPPENKLLELAVKLGGIDEVVLKNENLRNMIMHPLKEDYEIYFSYRYSPGTRPLTCPVTVMYCNADTPFSEVEGWRKMTGGHTEFYEFGDNHFFLLKHYREMADVISHTLIDATEL